MFKRPTLPGGLGKNLEEGRSREKKLEGAWRVRGQERAYTRVCLPPKKR